uniref:Uncharacterized protein n=1 Tax=Melopsittacus undulatus TaxID=13146 RepID=A0A8C6IUW2_MELUD
VIGCPDSNCRLSLSPHLRRGSSSIQVCCIYPEPGATSKTCPAPTALQLMDPLARTRGRELKSKVVHWSQMVGTGQTGFYRSATTTPVINFITYDIVLSLKIK